MFCPVCRDEYRSGFTRCATCDVDLVGDLGKAARPDGAKTIPLTESMRVTMADYCGFVTLEDAREARTRLWGHGIPSEIAIRLQPGEEFPTPDREEFWLRIPPTERRVVMQILGYDEAEPSQETFACSDCGKSVGVDESFCPHCGSRFE